MKSRICTGMILAIVVGVIALACEQPLDISKQNCNGLIDDVINLSQDQSSPLKSNIIKIYDAKIVSNTDKRLTCKGLALLETGGEQAIEYFAYVDRDGDTFIGYEGK